MPFKLLDFLARRDVPEAKRVVETAGHERLTVGTEGDGIHGVGVAVERADESRLLSKRHARGRQGDENDNEKLGASHGCASSEEGIR